jgi:peptidyl-prolyl cis-trans isomerase-like protein 2
MIQDPSDPAVCRRRDVSTFKLTASQSELDGTGGGTVNVKQNVSMSRVMAAVAKSKADAEGKEEKAKGEKAEEGDAAGGKRPVKKERRPLLTTDLVGAASQTSGLAGASLTSSAAAVATSTAARHATDIEIDDSVAFLLRQKKKRKSYATLALNVGTVQLELDSDLCPLTVMNFSALAGQGYYDNTPVHRLIKNFMVQMGDPTGTGRGGSNVWNTPGFPDEISIAHGTGKHDGRGVLSMANSGPGTNKSQFFLTFREVTHLDGKHTVFGRVIEGLGVLDEMEKMATGKGDVPVDPIRILSVRMVVDLPEEAEAELYARVDKREREERKERERKEELVRDAKARKAEREGGAVAVEGAGFAVGKYMAAAAAAGGAGGAGGGKKKAEAGAGDLGEGFAAPPKKKKKAGGFGNFGGW